MNYIIGSLVISFGILFLVVVILNAMQIQAPGNIWQVLGVAWLILAVCVYPFIKKIMR